MKDSISTLAGFSKLRRYFAVYRGLQEQEYARSSVDAGLNGMSIIVRPLLLLLTVFLALSPFALSLFAREARIRMRMRIPELSRSDTLWVYGCVGISVCCCDRVCPCAGCEFNGRCARYPVAEL